MLAAIITDAPAEIQVKEEKTSHHFPLPPLPFSDVPFPFAQRLVVNVFPLFIFKLDFSSGRKTFSLRKNIR